MYNREDMSLPARGVWVEISKIIVVSFGTVTSLPARGVWVEIHFEINHN